MYRNILLESCLVNGAQWKASSEKFHADGEISTGAEVALA